MDIIQILILGWIAVITVDGQGYMPMDKLRKVPPVMDGKGNDVYAEMEQSMKKQQAEAGLPDGMAILYNSAPIFAGRTSKDPEGAGEVYKVMPENEAVKQGAEYRRLLEDALIEMGFPLEELTEYNPVSGKVSKITGPRSKSMNDHEEDTVDPQAVLAALQGPLPYIRRGAWGRK